MQSLPELRLVSSFKEAVVDKSAGLLLNGMEYSQIHTSRLRVNTSPFRASAQDPWLGSTSPMDESDQFLAASPSGTGFSGTPHLSPCSLNADSPLPLSPLSVGSNSLSDFLDVFNPVINDLDSQLAYDGPKDVSGAPLTCISPTLTMSPSFAASQAGVLAPFMDIAPAADDDADAEGEPDPDFQSSPELGIHVVSPDCSPAPSDFSSLPDEDAEGESDSDVERDEDATIQHLPQVARPGRGKSAPAPGPAFVAPRPSKRVPAPPVFRAPARREPPASAPPSFTALPPRRAAARARAASAAVLNAEAGPSRPRSAKRKNADEDEDAYTPAVQYIKPVPVPRSNSDADKEYLLDDGQSLHEEGSDDDSDDDADYRAPKRPVGRPAKRMRTSLSLSPAPQSAKPAPYRSSRGARRPRSSSAADQVYLCTGECRTCDAALERQAFGRKSDLKRHRLEATWECPHCPRTCTRKDAMRRHLRKSCKANPDGEAYVLP